MRVHPWGGPKIWIKLVCGEKFIACILNVLDPKGEKLVDSVMLQRATVMFN